MTDNSNVTIAIVSGVIFLMTVIYLFIKYRNNNSPLRSYHENYDNLTNSIRILKAVAPLPTFPANNSCYEKSLQPDKSTQDKIKDAYNEVSGLIGSLQNSYNALKADLAYSALTQDQKVKLDTDYNNAVATGNTTLTNSKSITVNGKTINSWNGKYSCEDICQTNGSSVDKAYYTGNGLCTCPAGYYPQLDIDSFVKCVIYDTTNLATNINNQISNIISKAGTTFAAAKISFLCGGSTCPTSANISSSQTPASTTAPSTPASTTATTAPATPVSFSNFVDKNNSNYSTNSISGSGTTLSAGYSSGGITSYGIKATCMSYSKIKTVTITFSISPVVSPSYYITIANDSSSTIPQYSIPTSSFSGNTWVINIPTTYSMTFLGSDTLSIQWNQTGPAPKVTSVTVA